MERARAEKLPQQMRRTIRRYAMLPRGSRVVAAVSGGADSVALLVALRGAAARLGIEVMAAHFNHRLRGRESERDEQHVADLCARLDVALVVGRAPQALQGAGLEAAARRERYRFLRDVARDSAAARLATAHTLDDQAETVLMRLLRGSGAGGLQAVRVRRGIVVRPLIECPRAWVLDFLAGAGESFRKDASNEDRRFLRNRVRHDVLPVLAAINPRVGASLARTALTLQAESRLLDRIARGALAAAAPPGGPLDLEALRRWPEPMRRRIVRAWLTAGGSRSLGHDHTLAVMALATSAEGASVDLPGDRRVVRRGGGLVLE